MKRSLDHALAVGALIIIPATPRLRHYSGFKQVHLAALGGGEKDSQGARYYKAVLQASNDRSSRIMRGEILKSVLRKAL
jgi:hypothetical protein